MLKVIWCRKAQILSHWHNSHPLRKKKWISDNWYFSTFCKEKAMAVNCSGRIFCPTEIHYDGLFKLYFKLNKQFKLCYPVEINQALEIYLTFPYRWSFLTGPITDLKKKCEISSKLSWFWTSDICMFQTILNRMRPTFLYQKNLPLPLTPRLWGPH